MSLVVLFIARVGVCAAHLEKPGHDWSSCRIHFLPIPSKDTRFPRCSQKVERLSHGICAIVKLTVRKSRTVVRKAAYFFTTARTCLESLRTACRDTPEFFSIRRFGVPAMMASSILGRFGCLQTLQVFMWLPQFLGSNLVIHVVSSRSP
jgi:hypothetical protein